MSPLARAKRSLGWVHQVIYWVVIGYASVYRIRDYLSVFCLFEGICISYLVAGRTAEYQEFGELGWEDCGVGLGWEGEMKGKTVLSLNV